MQANAKSGDASKYNLRCNRNISEKMTKKDFIYDIRRPMQTTRKSDGQKRQMVLPIQLRRKQNSDSKMPQYTVISTKNERADGSGDAVMLPEQRVMDFECNFCHEPLATLMSLSTHVKFHCRKYCKLCYWILSEDETMNRHIQCSHQIHPDITTNL